MAHPDGAHQVPQGAAGVRSVPERIQTVMDERAAILAARSGDRDAFAWLVDRHQLQIRALVAMSLADRDDRLDVVQETFVDAWRGLAGFDPGREFGPWLRTVCRNRVRQFLRQRIPRRRRELALVDAALLATPPAEDGAPDERIAILRHCVEAMAPEQRSLLHRRYVDGEAVQVIAQEVRKTPNAVSMILLRLKEAILRCMDRRPQAAP